jgi:hypothetical protein
MSLTLSFLHENEAKQKENKPLTSHILRNLFAQTNSFKSPVA